MPFRTMYRVFKKVGRSWHFIHPDGKTTPVNGEGIKFRPDPVRLLDARTIQYLHGGELRPMKRIEDGVNRRHRKCFGGDARSRYYYQMHLIRKLGVEGAQDKIMGDYAATMSLGR